MVVSGKFITSVGPGSAIEFALKLGEILVNSKKAQEVAQEMMVVVAK